MINKILKILIGIVFAAIILLIAFIIFFPFAYMKPKFPEQPKYSIAEKLFLEKLKKKYHCTEINRSYYNITAKEEDTFIKTDFLKHPFSYRIQIDFENEKERYLSDFKQESLYIKDSILNKNENLKRIVFYVAFAKQIDSRSSTVAYHKFLYLYDKQKDSLIFSSE